MKVALQIAILLFSVLAPVWPQANLTATYSDLQKSIVKLTAAARINGIRDVISLFPAISSLERRPVDNPSVRPKSAELPFRGYMIGTSSVTINWAEDLDEYEAKAVLFQRKGRTPLMMLLVNNVGHVMQGGTSSKIPIIPRYFVSRFESTVFFDIYEKTDTGWSSCLQNYLSKVSVEVMAESRNEVDLERLGKDWLIINDIEKLKNSKSEYDKNLYASLYFKSYESSNTNRSDLVITYSDRDQTLTISCDEGSFLGLKRLEAIAKTKSLTEFLRDPRYDFLKLAEPERAFLTRSYKQIIVDTTLKWDSVKEEFGT